MDFSMCWNPKVGSSASAGMDVLARLGQVGLKRKEAFLPPLSPYRLPAEGVAKIKGVPASLKITGVLSVSGLYFIPDIVKLTAKNPHHRA